MTELPREQVAALLDGTTPGPWVKDGIAIAHLSPPHGYPLDVCLMGEPAQHPGDIPTMLQNHEANAHLIAAAPDLARQLLAAMDRLADADMAQAALVERAAKKLEDRAELLVRDEGSWEPDTNVTNLPEWAETECEVLEESARLIRALAPDAGVKALAELRAERDDLRKRVQMLSFMGEGYAFLERDRDRLAAKLAEAEAQVAGLRADMAKGAIHYVAARGASIEEMREHLRKSEEGQALYQLGDCRLVWVNEGDLYNFAFRAALAAASPALTPAEQSLFDQTMAMREVAGQIAKEQME